MERGRSEQSLQVLTKIHSDASDPDGEYARMEHAQIEQQINYERTLPSSWAAIFTIPSYRKRAAIGFACMFLAQCTGTQVINSESAALYILMVRDG